MDFINSKSSDLKETNTDDGTGSFEAYNDGTSPIEVYSLTFFVPVCSLLISLIGSNLPKRSVMVLELFSINTVLLLALTSLSNRVIAFLVTLAILVSTKIFYIFIWIRKDQIQLLKKSFFEKQSLEDFSKKFIGDYRGHLLLATSICILAVDFAFFPVRFSKTEIYGWSIMDAGVGSFVLVHGMCSSSARKSNHVNSFEKCMLSSFPLFILGIIRFALTTAVGYHKVVPEYGIHWNFFFTLALTKVICYFITNCFPFLPPGISALMTMVMYQYLLSNYLTDFILSEDRGHFIAANKEGICSLIGFVSIYFCGVQLGQFLWKKRYKMIEYIYVSLMLGGIGIIGWMLMYLIHDNIQPVSRRMANLGYCIWVVSLTSLQITIHLVHQIINFILAKILQKDFSECLLWNAINYNGLFYFLIANVMTGVVNLAIKTENCEEWLSFLILITYLAILTLSVIIPYKKSVQLKFW